VTHVLDRPIWQALMTRHAALAEGDGRARRYDPAIAPFAATADDSDESRAALRGLARPGDSQLVLMADPAAPPPGFELVMAAPIVRMVASDLPGVPSGPRIEALGWEDAAAMLDLASLTKPGPFSLQALRLGDFWGVKAGGHLIAMAGERMKLAGHTELSGVATHPDHRGRGLGRMLSVHVARTIVERGDRPFLHAYASNATAIALYESIGFRLWTTEHVAMLRREG